MTAPIRREELLLATLNLGAGPMSLADYATTGLRVVTVAPSGAGKTNAGLVIAEQLSAQGWVSVLVDPEGELQALYGRPVADPAQLEERLRLRDQPIVVVAARDAIEFLEYGKALMRATDAHRKPVFLMCDEGQLFSNPKQRKDGVGESADVVNDLVQRGRKRALDVYFTAHRFSGSLHRSVFSNKNLTLIGTQEDPTAWSALAPQFRGSRIDFTALAALAPGEFYCFSRRGVDKLRMPMARALAKVALPAKPSRPALPATYHHWDDAMRAIPDDRLGALDQEVVTLLGAIAGLTPAQTRSGNQALVDERELRA